MYENLLKFAARYISLTEREKDIFVSAFAFREVPENFLLVGEGEPARELFFINKGLLRLFYNKNGEYKTAFIFRENLFASAYLSFLQGSPSFQMLETLEASELLYITRKGMESLYKEIPAINILTRKIAEERFINCQMILSSFLLDSNEERYRKFAEENGDLLLRVPHNIIASYLGITPVSLSRIRKRVMIKQISDFINDC
jgi:CRP-like cAMP-binding protein